MRVLYLWLRNAEFERGAVFVCDGKGGRIATWVFPGEKKTCQTLGLPCAARSPLVLTSVHAFIREPFSRASRRPCSGRALYAPKTPMNYIDGARSSGFPVPV
jgi:hypothetical protein